MNPSTYIHEYATCARTWATLCIYGLDPAIITETLGLQPTAARVKGQRWPTLRGLSSTPAGVSTWILKTCGAVSSRDCRAHLDWLLDRLEPLREAMQRLRMAGAKTVIRCFWASRCGHGGPTLSLHQTRRLADLEIELWFEIQFEGEDETSGPAPSNGRDGEASPAGQER